MAAHRPTITIIGAGLAGSLMSIYAARRGFPVVVYERRGDPREPGAADAKRSINLGLSQRGIRALDEVGLLRTIRAEVAPMRGRVVHHHDGRLSFQPYGTSAEQILHSVLRHDLNTALIRRAEDLGVTFHFGQPLRELDLDSGTALIGEAEVATEVIIGADGVHSVVRDQLPHSRTDRKTLEWGYKEVHIPAGPDGARRTDPEALHVWPGERGLIVAHPNVDGTLTGTVFLPHEGPASFATLTSPAAVRRFFTARFPDALSLMPDLVEEFLAHPVGSLHTIRTAPWHAGARVVLLGDAAHAVYPFYGQGMNSSFEDCSVLDACLAEHEDLPTAFAEFQRRRKRHTDVLAELSERNFVELRDRVSSPLYAIRKKADLVLNKLLGDRWMPLYTMISHTTVPYADALATARRQDRVLGALGAAALLAAGAGFRAARSLSTVRRRGAQC
ncbi:FAD-dependent oxidoreductase [Amycolatopsis cihanbeyliensis]|uniref:Kynurenine 3-monooxygenase n=1 Tax=Amycolatopsis cihanbeyliensis TaxID=1128664 RepID=A0A542DFG4_AMYCI|nr:NAD(P)/FAD-dependent oxidoreductase [Amycolatopsis cihanbeyliensis]TQJ01806.1 kynurenine 3-monooxygenase [Amycolatopsis cihanbeyliensis]